MLPYKRPSKRSSAEMASAKDSPPLHLHEISRQGVLGFVWEPGGRFAGHPMGEPFVARPMKAFKPKGLAVWDSPPGARIAAIVSGTQHEVLASLDPVPARLFGGFSSFEALRRQVDDDAEAFAGWGSFGMIYPGQELVLFVWGLSPEQAKKLEVAMWGMTSDL